MFRVAHLDMFLVILFIVIIFSSTAVTTSSITMTANIGIVTAEYSSEPTTESTTVTTTESTTVTATANITVPITENTTVPTIESATVTKSGSTIVPIKESTTVPTTEYTTIPTTESTTVQTTENNTIPTTESTTVQTTENTTVPTTETAIIPTTESTIMSTTESTIMPTTESTNIATTESTIVPTTESTTVPATENTIMSTTESTIMPMIGSTIIPTTESTIKPTIGNNIMPTTESTIMPATESTIMPTIGSTNMPTTDSTIMPTVGNTIIPATTESTTVSTAESTTVPTIKSTTVPTTGIATASIADVPAPRAESVSLPTTESIIMPTTESTIIPTVGNTIMPTIENTILPTTEITTVPTTESTTVPTIENTTVPKTGSTTVPKTETTTVPTTGIITVPTTESKIMPITESTIMPTTEITNIPTTISSNVPTTQSNAMPTIESSIVSIAQSNAVPTTESSTVSKTESITVPKTDSSSVSTTESIIESTTENAIVSTTESTTVPTTYPSLPGLPENVSVVDVTSSSIKISWTAHENATNYVIHYMSIDKKSCNNTIIATVQMNTTQNNVTTIILENLQAWTLYQINVTANSSSGEGPPAVLTSWTHESVPGAINNLTVVNATSRSIKICWEEPCPPNGNITGYIVNVNDSAGTQMNTTETKELCQVFESLLPYKNYSFDVTAKTKVGEGVSQSISVETDTDVPLTPSDIRCFVMSSTEIEVSWQKGEYKTGPTSYSVSAIDDKNNTNKYSCSTNGFEQTTCKITSLDEFWNYTINVTASTEKGSSISETCFNQTKEDAPGYVEFFNVSQIDDLAGPRRVRIIWKPPTEREQNGIIRSYNISWTPEEGQINSTDVSSDLRNLTVEVKSNIQYTFAIHALTIIPGKGNESDIFVQPGVPNKPRENASYPLVQQSTVTVEKPQRQIAVTLLPKTVLCGEANGKPNLWGVIVSSDEEADTGEPYSGSRQTYTKKKRYNTTWYLAFKQRPVSSYRVTNETWMPKSCSGKNGNSATASVFVVGTDGVCSRSDGHCNGYLDPGQLYRVKVFWCTDTACRETEYSLPIATAREEETSSQNLPLIIGSVAGSALAFIVIGIVSIYIWRRQLACFRKRMTKAEYGEDNVAFETEDHRSKREKRPVRLPDFHTHFETVSENSNLLLSQAFQELNAISPKFSTSDSELEETRMKNRYTNILPFNKTRVKLLGADDEPGSDYINANYIPGFSSGREYIAAQGPLESTINDFWRMIWEHNSSIIVMLTQCTERGRKKCEQYWPNDVNESLFYGDIVVQMESESHLPDFILRTFVLRLGESERRVRHYYYLLWPDMGTPASTDYMIRFVDTVRRDIRPDMIGPIIVHCSAGVGRTGTYIMLDTIIRKIQSGEDNVDIFGDILNLRNSRTNMVQTESQFVYIHECIHDYLMSVTDNLDRHSHIYENQTFLHSSLSSDTPEP